MNIEVGQFLQMLNVLIIPMMVYIVRLESRLVRIETTINLSLKKENA